MKKNYLDGSPPLQLSCEPTLPRPPATRKLLHPMARSYTTDLPVSPNPKAHKSAEWADVRSGLFGPVSISGHIPNGTGSGAQRARTMLSSPQRRMLDLNPFNDKENAGHGKPLMLLEANAGNTPQDILESWSANYRLVATPVTMQELMGISCKSSEFEGAALFSDILSAVKSEKAHLSTMKRSRITEVIEEIECMLKPVNDRSSQVCHLIIDELAAVLTHSQSKQWPRPILDRSSHPMSAAKFCADRASTRAERILSYAVLVKEINGVDIRMPTPLSDHKISLQRMKELHPRDGDGLLAFIKNRVTALQSFYDQGVVPSEPATVKSRQSSVLQGMFDGLIHKKREQLGAYKAVCQEKCDLLEPGVLELEQELKRLSFQIRDSKKEDKAQLINLRRGVTQDFRATLSKLESLKKHSDICDLLLSNSVKVSVNAEFRGHVRVGEESCSTKFDLNDLYQCMAACLMDATLFSSNTGLVSQIHENGFLSILLRDIQICDPKAECESSLQAKGKCAALMGF